MRQQVHVSGVRRGQGTAYEPILLDDRIRCRSGILIFSRRQELLHANRRALKLLGQLNQAEMGSACEIHSAPVRKLLNAIQSALAHRRDADVWAPFELKRITLENSCRVLIRGIGLADRKSHDDSRIVFVLDEVGPRQEHSESQRQVIGRSQERRDATMLGSAKLGSDRGVFDACLEEAP